jgi:YVTN family beta-propeller protein
MFVTNDGRNPSDPSAANFNTGTVSVISDSANAVVATVPVGPFPMGIAYDSAKGEMFVTNQGKSATSSSPAASSSVSIISDATNAVVATLPIGGSGAIAYDSGKGELFALLYLSNGTSIISDASNSVVATEAAGPFPLALAYDPGKNEIFVANLYALTVTILSDATTASTTSSTAASSSSLPLSYLALVSVNAAVFGILGLAIVAKRQGKRTA